MNARAFIVELFCGSLPLLSAKQSFENQDFVKPHFNINHLFLPFVVLLNNLF